MEQDKALELFNAWFVKPIKSMDVNGGFTCLNVRIGANSQVTNFACAEFILDSKYAGETPASAVVD